MLGEAAVFTGEPRSASISALEDSTLLSLSMSHLETLRGTHPSIYELILNRCLQRMATRVQEMGLEIARLGKGSNKAPTRKQESTIERWWKRLTGSKNKVPPSAETALRKLPKLKEADRLQPIQSAHRAAEHARAFEERAPQRVHAAQVLRAYPRLKAAAGRGTLAPCVVVSRVV